MRPLIATAGALTLLLSGCEKAMQDMYNQPKYKPMSASSLWPDGRSARPQEPDVVAHSAGTIAGTSSGRLGELPLPERAGSNLPVDDEGKPLIAIAPAGAASSPASARPPITMPMLVRGRERFDIYCAPCHSRAGDGDGMVVRRGFPAPPSYHSAKIRNAPDAHLFSVITNGYGVMYSYADRVAPDDRWAIVAYIRALQLSQHASLDDVPADRRGALAEPSK